MAAPGLTTGTPTIGLRESLADMIYRISPTDTPLVSMIAKKVKAKAIREEWQTGALAAVDTANAQVEGDDVASFAQYVTVRVGNMCQILSKAFAVSDTLEAVDEAGRSSELGMQLAAKSAEIKRDMEGICLLNQAASAGSPRKLGGLPAWIQTNAPDGSATALARSSTGPGKPGTIVSGLPTAATDGTTRAFTQAQLDYSIQNAWNSGGHPTILLAGAKQRTVFSGFDGVAGTVFHEARDKMIIGRADVYMSNFGDIRVVPDRFIRQTATVDREVFGLDEDMIELAELRPFQEKKLAKTGDSEKRQLIWEGTLKVLNEAAHFVVADLS